MTPYIILAQAQSTLPWLVALAPYAPYILAALPFLVGFAALVAQGRLRAFTKETVAAVYRVAIRAANELQDEGLAWLRSDAGIAYRQGLATRAYDLIPSHLGPVPVGLMKMVVSREMFCGLVETAFQEMCLLAERLELPEVIEDGSVG